MEIFNAFGDGAESLCSTFLNGKNRWYTTWNQQKMKEIERRTYYETNELYNMIYRIPHNLFIVWSLYRMKK